MSARGKPVPSKDTEATTCGDRSGARRTLRLLKALGGHEADMRIAGETVHLTRSPAPSSGAQARKTWQVPLSLHRQLLARGLLEMRAAEQIAVSAQGRAWLRRALSLGDGFADQHRETELRTLADENGEPVQVQVDLTESPLAWLAGRKRANGAAWLDTAQIAAGERLRKDYTRAGLMARVTADWSAAGGGRAKRSGARGGLTDLNDAALDARERVRRALASVGPELSGVLVDVCCELQGLEAVERRHGWPARSGKLVLQLALSGLARHYGLSGAARGPERSGTRHWGSEGYRPRLNGDAGPDAGQ
ncbi:DUF6456 domain-containing protein [Breoghania sp.]|uniref:DUF6456 domain-containing protein n=1 Tax=Breoghania sp. TaxID=2065378 RepID=UPI002AA87E97|nr:DUF6456 domain-containing protein [Breoghania sp.]